MADPKPLSRDQLAKFLPDQESIRRFEKLFSMVGDILPADVATLTRLSQEASVDANSASAKAQLVMDLLVSVAQDNQANQAVTDAKANQALAELSRIANALEVLAQAPAPREDHAVTVDYIDFPLDGPHVTQERRLQWNSDDGTIDVGLFNGVTLQAGQEMHYYAKNTSGVTISNGQSVMATGSVGASGKLTIAKAIADGSVPAHFMIGIATQDIAPNQFGYVTSFGLIRNINTTGAPYGEVWADGDLIYFSPTTPGGLTNVQPESPQLKTPQAIVVVTGAGNGSIFVRMSVGMKLGDSDDVHAPSPAAGSILIYDSAQDRWESAFITAGTNVSITNADGSITIGVAGAAPTGTAGGVLSGSYPNPGFSVDMATQAELDDHTGDTANPHSVTKAQVGLGNVTDDAQLKVASNLSDVTSASAAAGNIKAVYIVASSAVAVTAPANTSENTLASIVIPGNLMGPDGVLRIRTSWTVTNSANNKTPRVKFGGVAYTSFNVTTTASIQVETLVANRGSTNSQVSGFVPGSSSPYGTSGAALVTSSVDTTSDAILLITGQKASAAETLVLQSYTIELIRP